MKIVLATKNRHKFSEMLDILRDVPADFVCAADLPNVHDVDEDRDTIEDNARKKAEEIADVTGIPAMADDTGFFVPALNDEPGVFAARYAGENCTYADNVNKMLKNMTGIDRREARFETVVALAVPGQGTIATTKGVIHGHLLHESQGDKGFGYDPIFVPEGYQQTFAELADTVKNQISHRAKAFQAMIPILQNYLKNN